MTDLMRFGFTPLYTGLEDVDAAAAVLAEILADGSWDRPAYHERATVT